MTRDELERALNAYAEAKNRHDVDAIVAARSEDCFDFSVPTGLRVEGREGIRAYFTAFFEAVPDYFGDFDGAAFGEDTAVVWGRFGGTLSGSFAGVSIEGSRKLSVPCTFVCTFRDGELVSDVYYFDAATLAAQAGVPLEAVRIEEVPA